MSITGTLNGCSNFIRFFPKMMKQESRGDVIPYTAGLAKGYLLLDDSPPLSAIW